MSERWRVDSEQRALEANAKLLHVSGDGISHNAGGNPVEHEHMFVVDARQAGHGCIEVEIQGPSQNTIRCHDNRDGTCTVKYTVSKSGRYTIRVTFSGYPVSGSPFSVEVGTTPAASLRGQDNLVKSMTLTGQPLHIDYNKSLLGIKARDSLDLRRNQRMKTRLHSNTWIPFSHRNLRKLGYYARHETEKYTQIGIPTTFSIKLDSLMAAVSEVVDDGTASAAAITPEWSAELHGPDGGREEIKVTTAGYGAESRDLVVWCNLQQVGLHQIQILARSEKLLNTGWKPVLKPFFLIAQAAIDDDAVAEIATDTLDDDISRDFDDISLASIHTTDNVKPIMTAHSLARNPPIATNFDDISLASIHTTDNVEPIMTAHSLARNPPIATNSQSILTKIIGDGIYIAFTEDDSNFTVYGNEEILKTLRVEIVGPSVAEVKMEDKSEMECCVTYSATRPGLYTIKVESDSGPIAQSPYTVNVISPKTRPMTCVESDIYRTNTMPLSRKIRPITCDESHIYKTNTIPKEGVQHLQNQYNAKTMPLSRNARPITWNESDICKTNTMPLSRNARPITWNESDIRKTNTMPLSRKIRPITCDDSDIFKTNTVPLSALPTGIEDEDHQYTTIVGMLAEIFIKFEDHEYFKSHANRTYLTSKVFDVHSKDVPVKITATNEAISCFFTPTITGLHVLQIVQGGRRSGLTDKTNVDEKITNRDNLTMGVLVEQQGDSYPTIAGNGIVSHKAMAHKDNHFSVKQELCCFKNFKVKIEGPSLPQIEAINDKNGCVDVYYIVSEPGEYRIVIWNGTTHFANSPYHVVVDEGETQSCSAIPIQCDKGDSVYLARTDTIKR